MKNRKPALTVKTHPPIQPSKVWKQSKIISEADLHDTMDHRLKNELFDPIRHQFQDSDLWMGIKQRIQSAKPAAAAVNRSIRIFRPKWVYASLIIVALICSALFLFIPQQPLPQSSASCLVIAPAQSTLTINSLAVQNQPATPVYFQSENKNTLIVWAQTF
jgi:hypothetical protein